MKKFALPFLSGIVLTLACVSILIALFFGSSAGKANCLPIPYPEPPFDAPFEAKDVTSFQPYVFRTKTSLQTIKDFYDTSLLHGPDWNDDKEGYWQRSEVLSGEYLYECFGTIGWDETETGCIYIRVRDRATIVERIWLNTASAGVPCEYYMSELPAEWDVNDLSK